MYWVVASPPKGETSDLTAQLGGRALDDPSSASSTACKAVAC